MSSFARRELAINAIGLAPPQALQARPPIRAPSEKTVQETLKVLKGCARPEFCDSMVVAADVEVPGEEIDPEALPMLQTLQGRYFAIGKMNDHMVWRQEANAGDAINKQELFLWYHKGNEQDAGWYATKDLGVLGKQDRDKFTWAPHSDEEPYPAKLYVPFWSRKSCKHVRVLRYSDWLEEKLEHAHAKHLEYDAYIDSIEGQLAEAQSLKPVKSDEKEDDKQDGWQEDAGWKRSGGNRWDEDGWNGGRWGNERGGPPEKRMRTSGQGGGWLNRTVPLVAAVACEQWEAARSSAANLASMEPMTQLMEKHVRKVGVDGH